VGHLPLTEMSAAEMIRECKTIILALNMQDQIGIIRQKLKELKRKDPGFQVFGASSHRYMNKGRLYEHEVRSFENRFNIHLPPEFREFILQMGNGGAGPYYGLEALEDGLFLDLDYKRKTDLTNPALEFPLTEAWNLELADLGEEEYFQKKDDEYFDSKWTNGLLRISNFGCGVSMNLVVNGKEYGNIWVDDRCNDGGIFPDRYFGNAGRITFLTWYELWLDKSLNEVASIGYAEGGIKDAISASMPWWKTLLHRKK